MKFLGTQGQAKNHFRADWYGENVIIIQAEDDDGKVIMVKDKVFVHFATRRIMGGDAEGLTESQRDNAFRDEIHDIGKTQRGMAFLPRDHSRGDPVSEEMKKGFYFVKEPRLFTTSKGTLLATHHIGRRNGPGEVRVNTDSHIGQGIAVSRSTDHGHSWDGEILVQQNRNHWGYTAMVEMEEVHNGKKVDAIYMYVSAGSAQQSQQPWANVDYRGIYYFKSIDDGATWTGPTEHVGLNKVVLKGTKPITRDGITYGNVPSGLAPTTNILKVPGLVLDGQTAPEGQGLLMHTYSWGYMHASIDGGTTWKKVADHDACSGVEMHNEVAWEVLDNDNQDIYMLFRETGFQGSEYRYTYKPEYVITREMTSAPEVVIDGRTYIGSHCGLTFRAKHDRSLENVPGNAAHHWMDVVPQGPDKGTLLFSTPGSRIAYARYHAWLWVSKEPITGEKTITSNLFQTPARVKHDVGWGQSAVEYLKSGLSNTRDMGKDAIVLVGESEPIHKDTHQIIDLKPDNTYTGDKFSDERFTATTFVLSWEYLELLLNPLSTGLNEVEDATSVTPPAVLYTGIVFTPDESGIAGSFKYTVSDGALTDKGRVTVGLNKAPVGSVALPGNTQVGHKLIADTSGITDSDGLTRAVFRYQWQSSTDGGITWKDIIGETFDDYTVMLADMEQQVRVLVSYRDDLGSAEVVTSTVVTVVESPPTMTDTEITSSGPYKEGDVIEVTVTYDEAVVVDTKGGTPSLTLVVGSDERQAVYDSGTSSNRLVFRYRVQSGETDTDGVVVKANSLTLNSSTIQDRAGNAAPLGHSAVTVAGSQAVDTTPATVTGTEVTSNGPYKAGDVIEVTVTYNEAVVVDMAGGTPSLRLLVGRTHRQALYADGTASNKLVFRYTVKSDVGGVSVQANSLALNGGMLKDRAGNGASLTHAAVDAIAPVLIMDASQRKVNAAKLGEGVPLATGAVRVTDDVVLQAPVPTGSVTNRNGFGLHQSYSGITTVVIDGSTYALVPSRSQGLQIIDISDPSSPQATKLIAKGNGFTALREPRSVATAVIDSKTYALVAASKSNGVQIIDISDPSSPKAIAAIKDIKDGAKVGDASFTELRSAWGITTAVIDGKTYALVAANTDNGVQIIDISTPSRPKPVAALEDDEDGFDRLEGAEGVTTVVIGDSAYALVAAFSDNGVQIIDISDPSSPQPVAALEDDEDGFTKLKGASSITTVVIGDSTYALVAAYDDDGVQIIDISNPSDPKAVAAIEDGVDGFDRLKGAVGVTTVTVEGRVYALVAANTDNGVQIIDISNPSDPQPVAAIKDGKGGFEKLKGAVGVTTVTVEGRVYALVTAYSDNAVQLIELPVSASIASIKINTLGLGATDEQLRYGAESDDVLEIGGQADIENTRVGIAGIDGLKLAWAASDKSITIRKADSNALTTVEAETIIAALRYTHGDVDNASDGERVFTFVLRDMAENDTAVARQVSVSVEVDRTPPAAPNLALNEDTGDSARDGVTSNGAFTVRGVEADASWEYSVDGGVKWQPGSGSSFTVAPGRYSSNSIQVRQVDRAGNASVAGEYPGELEVVPVPSTGVAITAITDDTGEGGDFITEDDGGLVLHARLSAPLKSGERLEYATSTDSGNSWSDWADISTSVSGVRVAHEDTSLTESARVRLRVVDSVGAGEIAEQLITISPAGSVPVSIRGIARQGEELSVDALGITVTEHQWQREAANGTWEPVSGATGATYRLVQADVGRRIRVQVTGTQSGSSVTFTSAVKGPVVNVNDAPGGSVALPGNTQVGDKLIADTGGITDSDGLTRAVFRYQWQRSADSGSTWADIIGEIFDDYTVVSTDTEGVQLRVLVSYRDDLGAMEAVTSTAATVVTTPTAPTMTGTEITSSGPYKAGDVIKVTVTYNEAVVVDTKGGTPSLTLVVGSDERQAVYDSGTGRNKLVFRYRVQSGETDTDGVVVKANSLTLSNGTIQDGAGNTTMLGHSGVLVNSNHAVDAAPPVVTDTKVTSNGPYKAGDVIEVTVTYNEAVVVDTAGGTPSLTLVVGSYSPAGPLCRWHGQ